MNYKLTIDINLMLGETLPAMEKLKRWKEEGKLELVEADPPKSAREPAYGWPGAPPKPVEPKNPRSGPPGRPKKGPPGSLNFKDVAAVLFPHRDAQKLNMAEINDVAHLIRHHLTKNELFVTHNKKDFIESGKRERLKASFGIIAMTPEEAVDMLSEIEGWK